MALGSFLVLSLQEGLLQAPDEPLSELHGRAGRATSLPSWWSCRFCPKWSPKALELRCFFWGGDTLLKSRHRPISCSST